MKINNIGDHVWAMTMVAVGAALVVAHQKETGELIIGGGLALFRCQPQNK